MVRPVRKALSVCFSADLPLPVFPSDWRQQGAEDSPWASPHPCKSLSSPFLSPVLDSPGHTHSLCQDFRACCSPETLAPWLRPALTWSSHFCLGHTPGGLAGCVGPHLLPLHRFAKPFLSSSVVRALRVSADSCLVPLSSVSRRPEGLALGPRLPLCLVLWVPGDRAHS